MATSSPHEMRIPHFPLELIYEILGNLDYETQTLESCSLVCKAWVHPSRSRLFEEVILDDARVKKFLAFSQRSTVVTPYIRRLSLNGFGRSELWNDCLPDLIGFQRVQSLTLGKFSSSHLSAQSQSTFFTQFTGIVRFCVIGQSEVNGSQLADIICSFPRLEVLDLGRMPLPWLSSWELPSSPRTISRHLHTFHVYHPNIQVLAWLLSFENTPVLHTLGLNLFTNKARTFNDLLRLLRSLERLYFTIVDFCDNLIGFIDLSHQKHLRTLHITGMGLSKRLVQTLASITSTCMDELIIEISPSQYSNEAIEWSEIDTVLQSPQFSNLRRVQFNLPLNSNAHKHALPLVLDRLSQCHGRGILSLSIIY